MFTKIRRYKYLIVFCVVVAMICTYYTIDPSTTKWSPKCIVYLTTGYKCPSCGVQRQFHHLLHGDFVAAVRQNIFIPFILLSLTLLEIYNIIRQHSHKKIIKICSRQYGLFYLCAYISWGIIRNLFNL